MSQERSKRNRPAKSSTINRINCFMVWFEDFKAKVKQTEANYKFVPKKYTYPMYR